MLKQRDLAECEQLFDLMVHPDVFPFVRHKAFSPEEFLFLTKQTIEAEEQGHLISRTILDEWGTPIGTINLFDVENNAGFLGTWLGKPYHGKGYNKLAKDAFFNELFFEHNIEIIFMKIRSSNIRSLLAAQKLPYISVADELFPNVYEQINQGEHRYQLLCIHKDHYHLHTMREPSIETYTEAMEA